LVASFESFDFFSHVNITLLVFGRLGIVSEGLLVFEGKGTLETAIKVAKIAAITNKNKRDENTSFFIQRTPVAGCHESQERTNSNYHFFHPTQPHSVELPSSSRRGYALSSTPFRKKSALPCHKKPTASRIA
jgi:hypothetical protein